MSFLPLSVLCLSEEKERAHCKLYVLFGVFRSRKIKGRETRDTKALNLSSTLLRFKFLVDVSRFSPCVINFSRNKNVSCGLKKVVAQIK